MRQILRQVTTLAHATCRCDSRFGGIQSAAVLGYCCPRRVFCVARILSGFGAEFGAAVVFGVVPVCCPLRGQDDRSGFPTSQCGVVANSLGRRSTIRAGG